FNPPKNFPHRHLRARSSLGQSAHRSRPERPTCSPQPWGAHGCAAASCHSSAASAPLRTRPADWEFVPSPFSSTPQSACNRNDRAFPLSASSNFLPAPVSLWLTLSWHAIFSGRHRPGIYHLVDAQLQPRLGFWLLLLRPASGELVLCKLFHLAAVSALRLFLYSGRPAARLVIPEKRHGL